jgi:uncharacterized protein (TIGR02996 family)
MTDPRAAIERQIDDDPDDPAGYLVYGDWLEARGDPRGTLIALHAARLAGDSPELRAAEAALLAEHRELLPAQDLDPGPSVEWYLGFWRSLSVGAVRSVDQLAPAGPERLAGSAAGARLASLLAHGSARFVREVQLRGMPESVFGLLGAAHRTLRSVDVMASALVTDAGLRSLRPLRELRQLALQSCEPVTPYGIEVLRDFRRLEQLDLRDCTLTDDGAELLAGLPLATLQFTVVEHLTARGMRTISTLPLRSLKLRGDQLDDAALEPLAAHPTLDNLQLGGVSLDADGGARGGAAIGTIPHLRRLYLSSSTIGDAGVARLQPSLRSLHLGHCESVSDAACPSIARMRDLRFLDLSSTQVTAAGLRMLAGLSELEHLDLGFLDLGDADLAVLAAFGNLRSLSLAYGRALSDAAIDTIEQLEQLQILDLANADISPAAIDRLARLPRLGHLGLHDCPRTTIEHADTYRHWYISRGDTIDLRDE